MVEVPRDDAVKLALSVLTAFDGSPSHVGRCVSVQPLFTKHREEGGEERGREAREQDGLNVDYGAGRTSPLWYGGSVIAEGGAVHLVENNTEESGRFVVRVRLEVGMDLYYERRGDRGEQTSLLLS